MGDISISNSSFELDEFSNSLDYLKKTTGFLIEEGDQFRYKWATLSLFHALYGFMLIVLGGDTNTERVIDSDRMPRQLKEQIEKIEVSRTNTKECTNWDIEKAKRKVSNEYRSSGKAKLIGLDEALKRIQKKIVLSADEKKHLKQLFFFRNEFVHFMPMKMLYSIDDFSQIIRDAVATIRKLCDSGNLWYYDHLPTIESEISKLEELLKKTKL